MAILSNGKFYGFLCSVKETGQKLANGVKEYMEDFVSGFAGHGWKLWEYVKGKWKLEIDTIVVRETMLVFEMLISKVRAIIGAQAITQGHGKVKSVRVSDDGTEFLIELEGEDMSIVAHDFVRCQTFAGDKTKLYHVEVSSVDVATRTLHVPLTEFDQDEAGNILNPPVAGDELVQFGNSQNKSRQSAIYLHADETGQPAIDVMFDIDSKNWEGKVKVRVGGDIPDSGGLKGFYCENGMIKGVNSDGHVVYCIYPDGTAEFGDGSARFSTDRSGHIAGGAISWQWNEVKQKYVCTMKDVVLTWENLSDEVKENLKGEPGKDANLLPWIEEWNNNKTQIGNDYFISPKMFSGVNTGTADKPTLTGIAMGRDCITNADGTKRTGIFALVDNEVMFELDPITKKYIFRGKVETQSSGKKIVIDPNTNAIQMLDSNGTLVFDLKFMEYNGKSSPQMVLNGNYRADNKTPYILFDPASIYMTDYTDYTSGIVETRFMVSREGIWFDRDACGFKLRVDAKKSDVSMGGVFRKLNLTRWNPGYLPHESQAETGDIYVNADGILRLKL